MTAFEAVVAMTDQTIVVAEDGTKGTIDEIYRSLAAPFHLKARLVERGGRVHHYAITRLDLQA